MQAESWNEQTIQPETPRQGDALLAFLWQESPQKPGAQNHLDQTNKNITDSWDKVKTNPVADSKSITEYIQSVNEIIRGQASLLDSGLLPHEKAAAQELFAEKPAAQILYAMDLNGSISPALRIAANASKLTGTLPADTAEETPQDRAFILELRRQAGAQLNQEEQTGLNIVIRSNLEKYFAPANKQIDYASLADKLTMSPEDVKSLQQRYLDSCKDLSSIEDKKQAVPVKDQAGLDEDKKEIASAKDQAGNDYVYPLIAWGGGTLTALAIKLGASLVSRIAKPKTRAAGQTSETPQGSNAAATVEESTGGGSAVPGEHQLKLAVGDTGGQARTNGKYHGKDKSASHSETGIRSTASPNSSSAAARLESLLEQHFGDTESKSASKPQSELVGASKSGAGDSQKDKSASGGILGPDDSQYDMPAIRDTKSSDPPRRAKPAREEILGPDDSQVNMPAIGDPEGPGDHDIPEFEPDGLMSDEESGDHDIEELRRLEASRSEQSAAPLPKLATVTIEDNVVKINRGGEIKEHPVVEIWKKAVDELRATRRSEKAALDRESKAGRTIDPARLKALARTKIELTKAQEYLATLRDSNHLKHQSRMDHTVKTLENMAKQIRASERAGGHEQVSERTASARSKTTVFTMILRNVLESLMR